MSQIIDITPSKDRLVPGESKPFRVQVTDDAGQAIDPVSLTLTLRPEGAAATEETWTDGSGTTQGNITRTGTGAFEWVPGAFTQKGTHYWGIRVERSGGLIDIEERQFEVFPRKSKTS